MFGVSIGKVNGFNPRTRESATGSGLVVAHGDKVSIHALVRVRLQYLIINIGYLSFNPRTRESATLAGEHSDCQPAGFNPRTRESATDACRVTFTGDFVSIHALVRVRLFGHMAIVNTRSFNPRTRESATYIYNQMRRMLLVSIHALVRVRLTA